MEDLRSLSLGLMVKRLNHLADVGDGSGEWAATAALRSIADDLRAVAVEHFGYDLDEFA